MTFYEWQFHLFYEQSIKNGWSFEVELNVNRVKVYYNDKTVEFDGTALQYKDVYEIVQLISYTFDSIPNVPKMKKSKRWRKLTL